MLRSLRDVEGGEIQYELVEACEAYDLSIYVREFLAAAAQIRSKAPRWGTLMFQSILNSSNSREEFTRVLGFASSEVRAMIRGWASEIASAYPSGSKYEVFARGISDAG
jgi:hypothetical protein